MRGCTTLLSIITLAASNAAAQTAPEAYSFYTILGQDTIAVEQVVRTGERLDVDMIDHQRGVRDRSVSGGGGGTTGGHTMGCPRSTLPAPAG